jgi:hypothetical protein
MIISIKSTPIYLALIVFVAILAVIVMPRFASAEAGSGGGGGSSGCGSWSYSTCVGAVWRYYKSSSNSYPIKNVGAGYTYVNGCASRGGFFAYVLVNRYAPNDASQVRSWKIGPNDGDPGDRSRFFGGWTKYYLLSNRSDPIPTNPSSGMYSWYSAEKAFAQTKSLGQNSGFAWNGSSSLGWFCYQGTDFNLTPTITGSAPFAEGGETLNLTPVVANSGGSASPAAQWKSTTFTVGPSGNVPAGGDSGSVPELFYGNGARSIANGSAVFNRGNNNNVVIPAQTIGDFVVGTRVCFTLSVQPVTQSSNNWRHSTPFCVTIGKKPKVQVHGGDCRRCCGVVECHDEY